MIALLKRLYVRWHDRHDPCARVTGYSRRFVQGPHDEQKASDAARRADHAAKLDAPIQPVDRPAKLSKNEMLAAYFHRHRGQWIDGRDLEFAGRYGWRSRVSNIRKPPFNMTIENRQRNCRARNGNAFVVSEYRFPLEP